MVQLRKNEDDLGNFEAHKKLTRHIFPSLKTMQLLYLAIFH